MYGVGGFLLLLVRSRAFSDRFRNDFSGAVPKVSLIIVTEKI